MRDAVVNHFTTDDGCRIAFRMDGPETAPVLLLSNSLGTDMAMWDPQLQAFSRQFRVLRYDSRGHGRSDSPAGGYSMDRLGRDALQLLDHLGIESVHFCGLSKGGMVGQWLGVRAPERIKRKLADADPGRSAGGHGTAGGGLAQALVYRWLSGARAGGGQANRADVAGMQSDRLCGLLRSDPRHGYAPDSATDHSTNAGHCRST